MGSRVKIGRFFYRFQSAHGRQAVNGTEYATIRDDAAHTVSISDALPIDCQLAEASRETVAILQEQGASAEAGLGPIADVATLPNFGKLNARS